MAWNYLEEQFHLLRRNFAHHLPHKMEMLSALAERLAGPGLPPGLDELAVRLHGLIGTAATFQFPELSEQVRPLAMVIKKAHESRKPLAAETCQWVREHMAQLTRVALRIHQEMAAFSEEEEAAILLEKASARKVFVLAEDREVLVALGEEFARRNLNMARHGDFAALQQACLEENPEGVVVDLDLLQEEPLAQPLILADRFNQRLSPVPMVFLSSQEEFRVRLDAVRLGSTHFQRKPVDRHRLARMLFPGARERPPDPFRILVVDDDQELTRLYQVILEQAGMTVQVVNDPLLALKVLMAFRPELVILDNYMPGCTGLDLAAVIRQHDEFGGMPILFLSAEQNLGRRLSDRNLAHEDFLIKPVKPSALIRAVNGRMRQVRARSSQAEHLHSALLELENIQFALNQHAIVSIADAAGRITFVNDRFCQISGFTPAELIGHNHRIIKSNYHPRSFYQEMWGAITQGRVWHGQVKNRRRDGSFYWVEATIVPFVDSKGKPYEYISIRTDISRQKQAEEQARSMALFAELNPAPVLRVDGRGRVLEANPATLGLIHRAHGDGDPSGAGWRLQDLVPDAAHLDLDGCIRDNGVVSFGLELEEHYYHFILRGIADLGVVHVYGADLTDLRRAREELEAAKEYAENLIQSSLDMIVAVDLERRIIEFNRAAERCFGWSREEVLGRHIDILYGDEDLSKRPRIQSGRIGEFKGEVQNRRKDGDLFYSFLSSSVLRDKQGRPIGYMGISRDITEWKSAQESLRESEERTRSIVESSAEGIIVVSQQGIIELFNPAAEQIFGYAAGEVVGRNIALLTPPPHRERHDQYLADYLASGAARVIHRNREVEGVRKEGSRMPISLSVTEFTMGSQRMFTAIVSDITERKQAEWELRLAKEAAERANRAKSEFLSSMSHELRTPMNAILGFAQLLEYDPVEPLTHSQQDSVREIVGAGQHLLELINEVLDLAKIEAGKVQLTMEDVSLGDVVDECFSLASTLARKREITLQHGFDRRTRCRCHNFVVRGDRTRLKQVVLNLLSNAIKYNRDQGTVTLCCRQSSPERLRLQVKDTGIGIPVDKLSSVFQPFNRLGAETSGTEGTGIGLVITKSLVELMGGSIGVESEEGVGSTFWVELLVVERVMEVGEEEVSEETPEAVAGEVTRAPSVTLLYVDDTPANLKLVQRILDRHPEYALITAPGANLGLELARGRRPDIILLDINLPGLNGYQMLELLRQDPETAHIPVLAISANAMPQDVERGLEAGFIDYLTKPLHVERFMTALERVLGLLREGKEG